MRRACVAIGVLGALFVAGCECEPSCDEPQLPPPDDAGVDAPWEMANPVSDGGPSIELPVPDIDPVEPPGDGDGDIDEGDGDGDGDVDEGGGDGDGDGDGDVDEGDGDGDVDEGGRDGGDGGDGDGDIDEGGRGGDGDGDGDIDEGGRGGAGVGDGDGDIDEGGRGDGDGGPWIGGGDGGPYPGNLGCTRTQGYWRNHFYAWRLSSLTLGDHTYSAAEALSILLTPPRGDASLILAHQQIAALLNIAAGATGTSAVRAAQAWLSSNGDWLAFGVNASVAPEAIRIAAELAAYNEGRRGPGHCGGGDGPPRPEEPARR